jgi:hypothetical protein
MKLSESYLNATVVIARKGSKLHFRYRRYTAHLWDATLGSGIRTDLG